MKRLDKINLIVNGYKNFPEPPTENLTKQKHTKKLCKKIKTLRKDKTLPPADGVKTTDSFI
jgi:hypothetical protein